MSRVHLSGDGLCMKEADQFLVWCFAFFDRLVQTFLFN